MTTITESIPSLGSVPTTADPSTFDARADALLGTALPAFRAAINTWAEQANTVAGEVNDNAATATTKAAEATASALAATGAANYVGMWDTLTGALAIPASVSWADEVWILTESVADVTADEPGVSVKWQSTTPPALSAADQSQMEAATSNATAVTPLGANWHPGVAKAWLVCGTAGNILASHNIASITDTNTGQVSVTIAADFSSANYVIVTGGLTSSNQFVVVDAKAAGSFSALNWSASSGSAVDPTGWFFACFGDQA